MGVIIGNVLNIALDWLFIVPWGMGTAGAALATSLGYVASTGYYLWCVFSQKHKGNDTVSVSLKFSLAVTFSPAPRVDDPAEEGGRASDGTEN